MSLVLETQRCIRLLETSERRHFVPESERRLHEAGEFQSVDPLHTAQGKRGLSRGGHGAAELWEEFSTRHDELKLIASAKVERSLTFEVGGRQTRIGAFPVSIETATYARLARNAARSPFVRDIGDSLNGLRLVLGVDHLHYSKGIIHRIAAFDRFLETNPEWRSRVTLLQITPKSWSEIKDYATIENERWRRSERRR